jgi:hypothetical protein
LDVVVKFEEQSPPRVFEVGFGEKVPLRDCARIALDADEQVTFTTEDGAEYDLTRKSWGFYATPSLNGRLADFGLRAVLVRNRLGRYFVLLVERGHEPDFERYLGVESLDVVAWLDSDDALAQLESGLA